MVEHLPNMCDALSSVLCKAKKKKKSTSNLFSYVIQGLPKLLQEMIFHLKNYEGVSTTL
jgi:hypothetical protein